MKTYVSIPFKVAYFLNDNYVGTLDRDENLGGCGNGATDVIMEDSESDSKEKVVAYDVFGDSNMLARMVNYLGNVGTNIYQCSSIVNIVEAEECENNFPLGGAQVLNAYLFSKF